MNSTFFFYQDTVSRIRKFSTEEAGDIFRAMEKREWELDSIARVRANYAYLRSIEKKEPEGFDTSAVPYHFTSDSPVPGDNPLRFLNQSYYSSKDTSRPVFLEQVVTAETIVAVNPEKKTPSSSPPTHEIRPDWLLGIIIGSLFLLAWLKLFYNKFLDQTIQSPVNYQLSAKLLRDQNIFSRRVAFTLNINFVLIGASYVYLLFGFLRIRPFLLNDLFSFFAYAGVISALLILRFVVSHVIGHVFNRHFEFREYLHQLLLIYKSLGLYLLVLVIGIAYIREDLRVYLVYVSGLLIIAAFVLRIVKGMKIILNKKDVFIFYLILYLCTLEILPLLIFYRFFSSSIQAG